MVPSRAQRTSAILATSAHPAVLIGPSPGAAGSTGLFLATAFPAGALVFEEQAALWAPAEAGHATKLWALVEEAFTQGWAADFVGDSDVSALWLYWDDADDAEVVAAAARHGVMPHVVQAVYKDLARTNLRTPPPQDACGFWPVLAHMNHSCQPNAVVSDVGSVGTKQVVTLRPVVPGEELVFSYAYLPTAETPWLAESRKLYFYAKYGFDCGCPACRDDVAMESVGSPPV